MPGHVKADFDVDNRCPIGSLGGTGQLCGHLPGDIEICDSPDIINYPRFLSVLSMPSIICTA
jgi:hypothetical protein